MDEQSIVGEFRSPGGFIFGVQGWQWGDQRPTTITFFLDGTARVCDQHGRPIKGVVHDGKPCYFERCTHAEVIAALARERVDWRLLTCAGWPQLPYLSLKELAALPPTPIDELRKIKNATLRKDALRARREADEAVAKEALVEAEE